MCELSELAVDADLLYRSFGTLCFGERTKIMLAVLFSGENDFLLIDEPTNHLDKEAREIVKNYLKKKKGFILVSHDRSKDTRPHICTFGMNRLITLMYLQGCKLRN